MIIFDFGDTDPTPGMLTLNRFPKIEQSDLNEFDWEMSRPVLKCAAKLVLPCPDDMRLIAAVKSHSHGPGELNYGPSVPKVHLTHTSTGVLDDPYFRVWLTGTDWTLYLEVVPVYYKDILFSQTPKGLKKLSADLHTRALSKLASSTSVERLKLLELSKELNSIQTSIRRRELMQKVLSQHD